REPAPGAGRGAGVGLRGSGAEQRRGDALPLHFSRAAVECAFLCAAGLSRSEARGLPALDARHRGPAGAVPRPLYPRLHADGSLAAELPALVEAAGREAASLGALADPVLPVVGGLLPAAAIDPGEAVGLV